MPAYVDALPSTEAAELADSCRRAPADGSELAAAVEAAGRRISIADKDGAELSPTLHLLREDDEAYYLFIANTGEAIQRNGRGACRHDAVATRNVAIPAAVVNLYAQLKGIPREFNPDTGAISVPEHELHHDRIQIRTSFPALGSRIFVFPKTAEAELPAEPAVTLTTEQIIELPEDGWGCRLSECNNLVLDRPRFRIGDGSWQTAEEILRIDGHVRNSLGIKRRGGAMKQPWAREKPVTPKSVNVSLEYSFQVEVQPSGELFLAIEQPHTFGIRINGRAVSCDADCGWWVDRSLRRLPLSPADLRIGRNVIELDCRYTEDHPGLEIVYLLGNFGVQLCGQDAVLCEPPRTLCTGSLTEQGLPFYSGSVIYATGLAVPELPPGRRLILQVPGYEGIAVRVMADGRQAGIIAWEPNEVDLTDWIDGSTLNLGIELVGHRRNSHGPHHLKDPHPAWTGPGEYVATGDRWCDNHALVPFGLTVPPRLRIAQRR